MLLSAFFIVVFGLCAPTNAALFSAENLTHTQLYRRAVNLLRNDPHLRLLMYSPEIRTKIPKCMISNLLKKIRDGAHRTLETNEKFEINETDTDGIFYKGKRNISIVVKNSTDPYLTITSKEGNLPLTWTGRQYLKYAKPRQCIILGSISEESDHPHCTLWGYNNWATCEKIFVEKCGNGTVVNLNECTQIEELKGQFEENC